MEFLSERNSATTWQIHEFLKGKYRHAPTINCLGNLLGKHPEIYMISANRKEGQHSCRQSTKWRLK